MIGITSEFMRSRMNKKLIALISGIAVVLAFGLLLFGFTGVRTLAAMMILFILPAYLIMRIFFGDEEAIFFSLFISLGIFPILVWFVNRVIPSFRVSVAVVFLVLAAIGAGVGFMRRK